MNTLFKTQKSDKHITASTANKNNTISIIPIMTELDIIIDTLYQLRDCPNEYTEALLLRLEELSNV